MESNPYTTLDYLILPLLDEDISYADISKESGFLKKNVNGNVKNKWSSANLIMENKQR